MTRILLCAGEPSLAKGIEHLLGQVEGFELLPTCSGITALMESISSGAAPHLVLLDLTPDVTFALMSRLKGALADAKIVLWVNTASTALALQAMGLGVRGILRKVLPAPLQVNCLQRVVQGELWFEKTLTDNASSSPNRVVLTVREEEVVSLLAQGLKDQEIAATLKVSKAGVKADISRLVEKAGVKDRFELALFGLKNLTAGASPSEDKTQSFAAFEGNSFLRSLRSLLPGRPESLECPEPSVVGGVQQETTY